MASLKYHAYGCVAYTLIVIGLTIKGSNILQFCEFPVPLISCMSSHAYKLISLYIGHILADCIEFTLSRSLPLFVAACNAWTLWNIWHRVIFYRFYKRNTLHGCSKFISFYYSFTLSYRLSLPLLHLYISLRTLNHISNTPTVCIRWMHVLCVIMSIRLSTVALLSTISYISPHAIGYVYLVWHVRRTLLYWNAVKKP